ncbi:MAG TPA: hypothetical protein VF843_18485 [Streptosporangiaceae bacterium]
MTHARARRARFAAVSLGGVATVVVAASTLGPAAAARLDSRSGAAPAGSPVVISCTGKAQTRPASYVLACADGNAYLQKLHWQAWSAASAFASGTDTFRVCIPDCTKGKLHSFPVLVDLWRAQARPGHTGQRYFSRLTVIYTGARTYRAGGKTYRLPQTVTYPLSPSGGA